MREFFRGWRRKIGIMTLVMACVFSVGWVRSVHVKDEFSLRRNANITHHLISSSSRLGWKTVSIDDPQSIQFVINLFFSKPAGEYDFFRAPNPDWKWRTEFCGFEFGQFIPKGPPWSESIWLVPYWSITVPLTLLSAFLLLSKPRQSTQKKT